MLLLIHLLALAAIIYGTAALLPGVTLRSGPTALVVAFVYALVNWVLKLVVFKLLFFVSIPLMVLTLGIFAFAVNVAVLKLTDAVLDGFDVRGLKTTLLAALIISVCNALLGALL